MTDGCFTLYQSLGSFCMVKTSLEVLSLRQGHVWICSVLSDHICEMKWVTESGQHGINTRDHFCCFSTLGEPSTNQELNHKDHLLSARFPLSSPSMISIGYRGTILPKGQNPLPEPPLGSSFMSWWNGRIQMQREMLFLFFKY